MNNIQTDKRILKRFLKAGFVFNERLFPNEEGTPQGGVISPTLANMTLNGMETCIREHFGKNSKVNIVRYADDFVLTAPTKERAMEAKEVLVAFLGERGLELSEEKTLVTHIDDGFNFLGWEFRKYKGKLLIKPSNDSIRSAVQKIRDVVLGKGKALSQDEMISILNPILMGWTNYHKTTVSNEAFRQVGEQLFHIVKKWALRRHRKKGKWRVMDRYWHRKGTRKWVFRTDENELLDVKNVKIRRHIKVRKSLNPYIDIEYLEMRKALNKVELERGYRDKSIAM